MVNLIINPIFLLLIDKLIKRNYCVIYSFLIHYDIIYIIEYSTNWKHYDATKSDQSILFAIILS